MSSSQALIPYNPTANTVVAEMKENARPGGVGWAVRLNTLLSPSPGRTLNRIYTSLGGVLEKRSNRAAFALGLGPYAVALRIKSYFGNGEDRVRKLELLQTSAPPKLEKWCLKLVKYSLPTESASTQCQAFKDIVELVTLFPGLRVFLLFAKCLGCAPSTESISALWGRAASLSNEEWTFWKTLAVTALFETAISTLLEAGTVGLWITCDETGLGVIERILGVHDSSDSPFSRALCLRYLGGILDLPGFWLNTGSLHGHVANKLCCEVVRVLKDIGVDVLALGPTEHMELPYDYDGIDFLATNILTGISGWLVQFGPEYWSVQLWHDSLREFLWLLRMPRSAELLPNASACASSIFQDFSPAIRVVAGLNTMVDSDSLMADNQDSVNNYPLVDLDCKNDSTTSLHSKIPDQEDGQSDSTTRVNRQIPDQDGQSDSTSVDSEIPDQDDEQNVSTTHVHGRIRDQGGQSDSTSVYSEIPDQDGEQNESTTRVHGQNPDQDEQSNSTSVHSKIPDQDDRQNDSTTSVYGQIPDQDGHSELTTSVHGEIPDEDVGQSSGSVQSDDVDSCNVDSDIDSREGYCEEDISDKQTYDARVVKLPHVHMHPADPHGTVTSVSVPNSVSGQQLSNCTLTLRETILTIGWTGAVHDVTVNLNLYVAYIGGELRWVSRGTGGFRNTCQEKSILLEGAVLVASGREGHSGNFKQVRLDLNSYITLNSATGLFEPKELEVSLTGAEKILDSSRSLLDISLISSFNLSKLLRDPAFHKTITDVAERAENDAHDHRLAVMSQMNEEVEEIKKEVNGLQKKLESGVSNKEGNEFQKRLESIVNRFQKATEEMKTQLESISQESAQRLEREMTILIDAVTKMAMKTVYAQIRELELKVLTVQQQEAYEVQWPSSYKTEGTTTEATEKILLRDPAFHKTITNVAERAENDAHDHRLAVMSQMNEEVEEIKKEVNGLQKKLESGVSNKEGNEFQKRLESIMNRFEKATEEMKTQLESISQESSQRLEREMTTLIDAMPKMAMKTVYAQIRELELKVLTVQQQEAYEAQWPPPPYKTESAPGSA
ncbi:High osmolarity signaling protein SHO1 [Mycena venus]|uniref:High osmolarity signaling protein SHO1 n=1 Tax=Mycena venus TaxID=2733690 RepID=A0A8H6U4C5_9AGAR|nr:High osmolarity signaling protein SHO1 [Mycena venus]